MHTIFREATILFVNAVSIPCMRISHRLHLTVIVVSEALVFLPGLSDFGTGRPFGQANGRFFLALITLAITDNFLAIDRGSHLDCCEGSEVVTGYNALG